MWLFVAFAIARWKFKNPLFCAFHHSVLFSRNVEARKYQPLWRGAAKLTARAIASISTAV